VKSHVLATHVQVPSRPITCITAIWPKQPATYTCFSVKIMDSKRKVSFCTMLILVIKKLQLPNWIRY